MTHNYKLMLQRAAKAVDPPVEWKQDRLRPEEPNAHIQVLSKETT